MHLGTFARMFQSTLYHETILEWSGSAIVPKMILGDEPHQSRLLNPTWHLGIADRNPTWHLGIADGNPARHLGIADGNPARHLGIADGRRNGMGLADGYRA